LLWHFSGLESLGKRLLVLERSDNLLNTTSKNAKQKIVVCSVEILGYCEFWSSGKINLSPGKVLQIGF